MENGLESRLNKIKTDFAKMCRTVESMLAAANGLLKNPDKTAAKDIVNKDKLVDEAEMDIENGCMRLLLRNQPFAKDFRDISCILKAITDVERIGDQAGDIAEIMKYTEEFNVPSKLHIGDMARATIQMVTDSIESFVKKDYNTAIAVIKYDDKVDHLFAKVKKELTEYIAKDPENGELYLDLLMIAKYFERIGDHATNIAGWVCYSITGKHNSANN